MGTRIDQEQNSRKARVAEIQDRLVEGLPRPGRWTFSPVGDVLELDAAAAALLGQPEPGSVLVSRLLRQLPPDERGAWLRAVEESCRSGARLSLGFNCILPGGAPSGLQMTAEPIQPGTARVVLAGILTKSQVIERESGTQSPAEARLSDFTEMAEEWLWEMDADLRFSHFSDNSGLNESFDLPALLGRTRREILSARTEPLEADMHLAWIAQKRPFRDFRYWRTGINGEVRYVSTSGKPLFDVEGRFCGYRGVGRDLTAQQQIRDQLIQANRQLNTANKAKSDAMASLKEANALLEDQNEEMARVEEEIRHKALHDPLTGVGNRRFLDACLADSAAHCRESNNWLGILHVDLDRFKQINDTMGHAAGDAVLAHVAEVLENTVGPEDFVARVGGDEFVVVRTTSADQGELGVLAQQLIEKLGRPFQFQGRECWFGASVGIAVMRGEDIVSDELLMNADIALYRAKNQGRGCYQYFSNEVQQEILRHKVIADGIRAGLAREEFVPWYQPQVCSTTRKILGFEALARWYHPEKGVRPPAAFLDVAEDLNAVPIIDRMILEQSLSDLADWDAQGFVVPKLSVNVSARRLLDPDLHDTLARLSLPRGRLAFELLESVFLDDMEEAMVWNIDRLKEMGVDIQLDDFGSGHASIVSLVKLAPDAIKIDRQMTAGITLDTTRRDIVGSIIGIGKTLGVSVIAEGVETEDQAGILAEMGCDALQGYLFAKPMPAADVGEFVTLWGSSAPPETKVQA